MIDLSEYHLKEKYRKVLEHLSDDDKVRVAIEKYNNINVLKDIVIYYDLQDNPLLKTLGLTKYGKDPEYAYEYARWVIRGRWVEAEDVIKTHPWWAYCYAFDVIKGRFTEAEEYIKNDPRAACHYAENVILDREFDLESLCSFGNISFVIGFNLHDFEKLTKSLRYVIDNKIPMNKSNIVFQSISEDISHRWFENWKKEQSVIVGATLVDLCDYLKINIEPIDESIADWNIEESEVECIARTNKEELKKFARLFRKPINKWYGDKWLDI